MKDLSYLEAFSPKVLRETRRILRKGFTTEDIDSFLGSKRVQIGTPTLGARPIREKRNCKGCKE